MEYEMNNYAEARDKTKEHFFEPIIRLSPAFKDTIWGGTRLKNMYYRDCGYDRIGEVWYLADTPECCSRILGGRSDGMELSDYLSAAGRDILGTKCRVQKELPLLVKLIDAGAPLSVQVHPGKAYTGGSCVRPKSEYWYVISSEPGAGVYIGFRDTVTRGELEKRIKDGSVLELMNFFPTKPGDFFFVPAGTIHSVGGGNLICEVQQNSTCSYRLYDFERLDSSGKPRELNIEKALAALELGRYYPVSATESGDFECEYFRVCVYTGSREIALEDKSFYSLLCLRGSGSLSLSGVTVSAKAGDSFFIPAQRSVLRSRGDMTFIISNI